MSTAHRKPVKKDAEALKKKYPPFGSSHDGLWAWTPSCFPQAARARLILNWLLGDTEEMSFYSERLLGKSSSLSFPASAFKGNSTHILTESPPGL